MRTGSALRGMITTAAVAAVVLVAGALSIAQRAPAPDTQNTLDYRTNPSMAAYRAPVYPDDAYVRMPLPASEQAYKEINGLHIKDIIKEIVAISYRSRDAGDIMWGRIPGTQSETWTNEWVEARFRAVGLKEIRRQPFDLPPQWFPVSYDFSVISDGVPQPKLATVRPATGSGSLPAAGLDLEPVWVGLGSAADFIGRDVRGKAVVISNEIGEAAGSQTPSWMGASKRAQDKGAAALVIIYGNSGNMTPWGPMGAGVTLPGVNMGYQDGLALRELIGTGKPVKLRIKSQTKFVPNLKSTSVWGTLPGATDENIILMAHQDAYFDGALDNASGMAVMLALAEHYAKIPQAQRRRTILFVATAGHHAGSPNSKWLHEHRETALAKTALMMNFEHIGAAEAYIFRDAKLRANEFSAHRYYFNGSGRLREIVFGTFYKYGIATFPDLQNGQGEMNWVKEDAPSVQILRSPDDKHSDADTIDWVAAAGLEAVARAHARIIDDANKVDRKDLLAAARMGTGAQ
jgi:Peptidase family M28